MPQPRASSSPSVSPSKPRISHFAAQKHWLGWQGFTCTLPADWNLASFGGTHQQGTLRVDDGDGPRVELRWETPERDVDLEKSIADFTARLQRNAKKKKQAFQVANHPHIVAASRKNKAQLVNFGWTGDNDEPLAAHGWGTAWRCPECKRVVVAHLIGRAREKHRIAQQLAAEIFSSLECHGQGGWQAWSVFGLSAEIPLEFALARAKFQTGRLEIEWERPVPQGPRGWLARPERLNLRRFAAANVVLERESLADWAKRTLVWADKKVSYATPEETEIRDYEALLFAGAPRVLKQRLLYEFRKRVRPLRAGLPEAQMRVWHDKDANKILVLESELTPANTHVTQDVLDSLDYQ
jgi:hypothetical protein